MGTHRIKALAALLSLAAGAWAVGGCGTEIKDGGTNNQLPPDGGIAKQQEPDAGTPCHLESQDLQGLWGSSSTDVWTVGGEGGLVFHNTTRIAKEWTCYRTPIARNLAAVWGSGESDVWFVGAAEIDPADTKSFLPNVAVHWDGSTFATVDTGIKATFASIWGTARDDIWVGGYGGALGHYDGVSWSSVPSGTDKHINALWGSSATDIWAVGEKRLILHYDGTSWKSVTSTISKDLSLLGIWGTGTNDVYIVGGAGTVLHWNGAQFEPIQIQGAQTVDLSGIWGSDSQIRVVGTGGAVYRYKNNQWGAGESPGGNISLTRVWGMSINDYWIVGNYGTSRHYQY